MDKLKKAVRSYYKKSKLKYNYFSCHHPKKSLQCRSFKFIGKGQIQFLQTGQKRKLEKGDLNSGGKKQYWPADGA